MIDFCVLGSGVAGSTIANILSKKYSVHVFDKARGSGGRSSNKKFKRNLSFDHGAQYISPKSNKFIKFTKKMLIANKESVICGWNLIEKKSLKYKTKIIPIDSEHFSIFKLIENHSINEVKKIYLTASGGPFLNFTKKKMKKINPHNALKHPKWKMGKKITIDSATLMNKSLEVIEAAWLFGADIDQVEVVIHPQSIVHSMVEFKDGSVLAQLSNPDMVFPIQYALTYPERYESSLQPMDFTKALSLDFESPDHERFPSIKMAKDSFRRGGTAPAVFNAANEVAVAAFLAGSLKFSRIWDVIQKTLDKHSFERQPDLGRIIEADSEARIIAEEIISQEKL